VETARSSNRSVMDASVSVPVFVANQIPTATFEAITAVAATTTSCAPECEATNAVAKSSSELGFPLEHVPPPQTVLI